MKGTPTFWDGLEVSCFLFFFPGWHLLASTLSKRLLDCFLSFVSYFLHPSLNLTLFSGEPPCCHPCVSMADGLSAASSSLNSGSVDRSPMDKGSLGDIRGQLSVPPSFCVVTPMVLSFRGPSQPLEERDKATLLRWSLELSGNTHCPMTSA